jgi:diacylglycerol kinase (ATP)
MTALMVVIGNPGAGSYSRRRLDEAVERLSSAGTCVEVFLTRTKGDAETEAKRITRRKPAAIVVAGGDGTINDVANGLAMSPVAVGILPMGSVNVLSREVGISKDVGRASRQIMEGREHPIALGRISSENGDTVRYFLLMADIGYGGRTVAELNNRLKCLSSRTAFVVSGTKNLLKKPSTLLTFTVDGTTYEGYHAIIGKSSRYGGNFRVTPHASIFKNELYVCIFQSGQRLDLAKYVIGVATGRHHTYRDVVCLQCRQIIVEGRAHIQVDGNYLGKTPVKIDIVENALNLIY